MGYDYSDYLKMQRINKKNRSISEVHSIFKKLFERREYNWKLYQSLVKNRIIPGLNPSKIYHYQSDGIWRSIKFSNIRGEVTTENLYYYDKVGSRDLNNSND